MPPTARADASARDIIYPKATPFVFAHLACLAAIWTGVTWEAVALGAALYVLRMFGVTAGYHRYFSHRAYKTSRVGQFLLAWLAQSSAQRSVLWWAAKHRHHHRHSDTPLDIHSPRLHGLWNAHVGWLFADRIDETNLDAVRDLTKYPELLWLHKHHYVPAIVLAVLTWLVAGWPGLAVGFFWSTVVLYHGTFTINSLSHTHGTQRYVTGDDSRNNPWLAIITLGEGWHNNHHAYQSATRQGFFWWEFDPTFYALKVMSWLGLVWNLRAPPPAVLRNERPPLRAAVEQLAAQIAASYPTEGIAARFREAWANAPGVEGLREAWANAPSVDGLREAWANAPGVEELRAHARDAQASVSAQLAELYESAHVPGVDALRAHARDAQASFQAQLAALQEHVPSLEEVQQRAQHLLAYAPAPSLEPIATRARELILEAVARQLGYVPETQAG